MPLSSKVYRAALIGCGKIASEFADDPRAIGVCTHAGAYEACPQTQLVAVADANTEKVARCGERWKVQSRYRDPFQLLKEQKPEIVSICTPDGSHYELIRTALLTEGVQAVLAEKPLAIKLEEAEELVRLARQRNIILAVNYSRRYSAELTRLRDGLNSGQLGELRVVRGLYTKGTLHNGTHWYDLLRFLAGEVEAVRGTDRLHEPGPDPTLDVTLTCQSGAVAELHACSPDDFTVFEMDLIGTRGRVQLTESCDMLERYEVIDGVPYAGYRSLVLAEQVSGTLQNVLLHAVEDVVDCLESGRPPRCSGEDGQRALQIGLAARTSAASGETVMIAEQARG